MKRFSFSKTKRLVRNTQFRAVLARNRRASNGLLRLFMLENDTGCPRLGISVGKSCGKAVVRNQVKRLFREVFRQNQDRIPAGFDYVIMLTPQWSKRLRESDRPKAAVKRLSFDKVQASFLRLVETITKDAGKT